MKNYLFIIILFSIISCNENVKSSKERKSVEIEVADKIDDEIEEIGNFYRPEKMVVKQKKVRNDNKKEDYQITLTNSDLLDDNSENIEKQVGKIVQLYYKNLTKNNIPFNYNKIIVKIEHRNGKKEIFKYTDKDF